MDVAVVFAIGNEAWLSVSSKIEEPAIQLSETDFYGEYFTDKSTTIVQIIDV